MLIAEGDITTIVSEHPTAVAGHQRLKEPIASLLPVIIETDIVLADLFVNRRARSQDRRPGRQGVYVDTSFGHQVSVDVKDRHGHCKWHAVVLPGTHTQRGKGRMIA